MEGILWSSWPTKTVMDPWGLSQFPSYGRACGEREMVRIQGGSSQFYGLDAMVYIEKEREKTERRKEIA